ncbi:MAG: hypothetical protein V4463_11455 [Pseudomonadota bacterium]
METVRPGLRLAAPFVLIAALLLAMVVLLNLGKLERTLADVEESRLRYIVGELREKLEAGIAPGVPLSKLGNAQVLIDAQMRQDRDIISLSVIDPGGTRVFHHGAEPAIPFEPLSQQRDQDWSSRDAGSVSLGSTLSDSFGAVAGAVVLRYSNHEHGELVNSIALRLALAALGAAAAVSLCFMGGLHFLARRLSFRLASLEDAIEAQRPARAADPRITALAEQVKQSSRTALVEVTAARQALAGEDAP